MEISLKNDSDAFQGVIKPNIQLKCKNLIIIILILSILLIALILLIIFVFAKSGDDDNKREEFTILKKNEDFIKPNSVLNMEFELIELNNKLKIFLINDNYTSYSSFYAETSHVYAVDTINSLAHLSEHLSFAGNYTFNDSNKQKMWDTLYSLKNGVLYFFTYASKIHYFLSFPNDIINNYKVNRYHLYSDQPNVKIMKIEIAKNNINIYFTNTFTNSSDYRKNMTFIKSENKYGKNIILLEIPETYDVFLNIFLKDKSKIDNEKLNIVFRYDVFESQEKAESQGAILKSENIDYTFEKNKLNINLKPMQLEAKTAKVTYSIRILPQDNVHEEEILDSVSLYYFENEYTYNKQFGSDFENIQININDFPTKEEFYYIIVYEISLETKEFFAYKLITIGDRSNLTQKSSTKYRLMMFILFGGVGILVLVLIIVIIRMKKQNAELEDEVEVLKINFDELSEQNKNGK